MKRITACSGLLLVASLAAGCAADTAPIDAGAVPRGEAAPAVPAAGLDGPMVETTVYFTRGTGLVPATRIVPDRGDLTLAAADALRELLDGPTAEERAAGLGTEIPAGTRLLDLHIGDDRIASVDLSREFETGGGTAAIKARLGQVVCTLDNVVALDIADGTRFLLDGEPVEVFSGQGIVLDGPVSCADYQPIPTSGGSVTGCDSGWYTPPPGDPMRAAGMELLRASLGTSDRFVVEDLRYFTGGDGVERWYVKARLDSDPTFRGRFLVERRGDSGGVVAVAAADTRGWESPDWAGFEGEGDPIAYPHLPGRWAGVRYDFVSGTGGPGVPGLPGDVTGCVMDT